MNILVLGGTRFFGLHLVRTLLDAGHQVTIATRGTVADPFQTQVTRIRVDRTDAAAMNQAFQHRFYDVVCDNIAYCSNDVRAALNAISCDRYILTSSVSVCDLHPDIREEAWLASDAGLVWCERSDCNYDEGKRQAECALFHHFSGIPGTAVRFPFVIGPHDYTGRLRFYVEHVRNETPMYIDNLDAPMSFISEADAGRFLAFLASSPYTGPINGSSRGTVTPREILNYTARKTGKLPLLSPSGTPAPYNGAEPYSININRAEALGFSFSDLHDWLPSLLDHELARP